MIIILRLLVPLFIFVSPLVGIIGSISLDLFDYYLLPTWFTQHFQQYQELDKLLDLYYLTIAYFTTLFWKDKLAKKISSFAFLYRVLGVSLFLWSKNRLFLFLFPNFFENFFLFYLTFSIFTKDNLLLTSKRKAILITSVCLFPKIFQEYSMHILQTTVIESLHLHTQQPLSALIEATFLWGTPIALLIFEIKKRNYHTSTLMT